MKTILVLTDLSPKAEHVALQAVKIAQKLQANILLFNCYDMVEDVSLEQSTPWPADVYKSLHADTESQMQKLAEKLVKSSTSQFKPNIQVYHNVGEIDTHLPALSAQHNVFLIIMGSRHDEHLSRSHMESEARIVLFNAGLPVLYIPKNWYLTEISRISLATDLTVISEDSKKIIDNIATLFGASVKFVHVTAKQPLSKVEVDNLLKQTSAELPSVEHEITIFRGRDLGSSLREYVKISGVELLIMIHHHDALNDAVSAPSYTAMMLDHLAIPLLILHQ